MPWIFLAIGAAGVLIGVRFKVSTLLATCFATIVASVTTMKLLGFSGQHTLSKTLLLLLTLQGTYLIGLTLASLRHRSVLHDGCDNQDG
ncbi:hypothetical protein I6F11_05470 [Ensifer sp. NBAIM29]|nr:hypothetical protein [Ensifer sp. NBAIM29]